MHAALWSLKPSKVSQSKYYRSPLLNISSECSIRNFYSKCHYHYFISLLFKRASQVARQPAGDASSIPGLKRSPGEDSILVFLPGKFHGQRSLADYSSWG